MASGIARSYPQALSSLTVSGFKVYVMLKGSISFSERQRKFVGTSQSRSAELELR